MRKILLDEKLNYYKANMHCHSTYSDGKQTVEELKAAYRKQGYSIIAFTDHEHLIDNSRLSDESFLAITSCELAIKEFDDKSTLVCRDMKTCHLNLYSMDEHNINTPCYNHKYDKYTKGCEDKIIIPDKSCERKYNAECINKMIEEANKQGFLVAYNHPVWSLEDARDYLSYKGLWAIEIFNTECYRSGLFEYNIGAYDEFLRGGNRMGCIAGDDNHNEASCFGGSTMINAEKLDYNSVMNALKNNNYYASYGPEINGLYIEGNKAVITVPCGEYITLGTGTRRAERRKINGGGTYEFEFLKSDKYIRFSVIDEKGRRANTCAYFVA